MLDPDCGRASTNSSSSSEMSSTRAIAYRVLTDGLARPRSTCEMRLGETPSCSARARRLRPRAVRAVRSRSPISAYSGVMPLERARPTCATSLRTRRSYALRLSTGTAPVAPCASLLNSDRPRAILATTAQPARHGRAGPASRPQTVGPRRRRWVRDRCRRRRCPARHQGPRARVAGLADRRLGGARQPRPAPDLPARPGACRARRLGPGRGPAVRLQQHPVRDQHPHRRVGAGQDDPLLAAHPRRRAAPLGLRLGGQAPSPALPVAAARERARRDDRAARRGRSRGGPVHRCRPRDRGDPARRGRRGHAGRRGHRGAADAGRPPGRGDPGPGRPAGDARCPRGQVDRRDHAAQHGLRHGRRRLPADRRAAQAGHPREPAGRQRHQVPVRAGLGARRQHQRGLGRAVQPPPARVQRPDHPPRRPGVLRHHPDLRGLQDLLLPDVRGGQGERCPARRLQAGARVDRRLDRADASRA